MYRAVIAQAADPLGQRRLLVTVPDVSGDAMVWAAACVPAGSRAIPRAGTSVWVQFEAGDPERPVWIGIAIGAA